MTHQGDLGGATRSITWLCRGLAERGHRVFVACRGESRLAAALAADPVTLVETDLSRGPGLVADAFRWRRWVREHEIDVVNAHASLDRHLASYLRVLGFRGAVVHTRRNVPLTTGGRVRAAFDAATTDAIVCVSERVACQVVAAGVPEERVHTILNGLPMDRVAPSSGESSELRQRLNLDPGTPVVGVVARRKSQEDLLRAVIRLERPVEILFAGVEEDPELLSLARELPEGSRLHCLGYIGEVAAVLGLLDVFVLPSSIEGFSLALLEAMARGLPCIATDAGGNREALADGAGILVPPGDVRALANALAGLLDDADARREMGESARDRARDRFHVNRTVERTAALYQSILAGG
ncbi:MAG: glycosyltransferase family 4 protein [Gemmatimonadota bacterium]|nr:hypothetical protein [Gemmatimonadota bacterium]MDP6461186.1 glycosyltransferase family 4 protein [Gemmatimonadota bacterium]MDP6528922.1 glycosyltransferase family 4 protein [Gemmatimonadota bacterium]MDP6803225.1 glycosyltransferase family 4 protein [Gemmatimonadota bacterium]